MFLLQQVVPSVLLGMAVAAIVQGLALWRGSSRARALTPVALGLGYFCGHVLITGWTAFPPTDTTNWLPYFGLAAAGLGAFWSGFPKPAAARVALIFLAVGAMRLLLEPKFRYGWVAGQGWIWVIGLAIGVGLLGVTLCALARRSSTAIEVPIVLLVVSGGVSASLMLSSSLLLGQFGAVFAGAIFGTLVFSLRWAKGVEGIAPVFAVFIGVLLASGYFFAELPGPSAVLLAGAPVLALVPTGRLSGLPSAVVRIILVSLPVAAAIIFAFRVSPPLYY
jgi:hypothetical protein